MQNNDYITSEIDKNKEVTYTSDVLKDLLTENFQEKESFNTLITNKGFFNAIILMHSKTKTKTNIKLLIKKNILTELILSNILKLQIKAPDLEMFEFDLKESSLVKSSIYLNSNEDTIIKIKFLNEREK